MKYREGTTNDTEQEERKMTIYEYKAACMEFAADTKDWYKLPEDMFYMARKQHGPQWYESGDAMLGGINCEWAFHATPEEIEQYAPRYYLDALEPLVDQAQDEGWDEEQIASFMEDFT